MNCEVRLQWILVQNPLGEVRYSLPEWKVVLAENKSCVSDLRSTFSRWSIDSHIPYAQQLLYLTLVYQPQSTRCFLKELVCVQLFVDWLCAWWHRKNLFRKLNRLKVLWTFICVSGNWSWCIPSTALLLLFAWQNCTKNSSRAVHVMHGFFGIL